MSDPLDLERCAYRVLLRAELSLGVPLAVVLPARDRMTSGTRITRARPGQHDRHVPYSPLGAQLRDGKIGYDGVRVRPEILCEWHVAMGDWSAYASLLRASPECIAHLLSGCHVASPDPAMLAEAQKLARIVLAVRKAEDAVRQTTSDVSAGRVSYL
ncbi:MAG TPA: hypothetical protein VM512_14340 [Burkholderiaceae bacterium]|jgi:hypothetical protein|nr:hypothetical protein [Burkholderiaceae bacterium]